MQTTSPEKQTARRISGALVAIASVALLVTLAGAASAHRDPETCTATGVAISLTAYRADGTTPIGGGAVEPGETINYRTRLSHPGGANCNFEGGTIKITDPSGTMHTVSAGIPLVTTSTSYESSLAPYVVAQADESGGFLGASTSYTGGTAHRGESSHPPVSASTSDFTPFQDVALEVSKTAAPAYDRAFQWTIEKVVDVAEHTLETGQTGASSYTITLTKLGSADANHRVTGTITIENPAAFASASITAVTDSVSGAGAATVSCPVSFPHSLAPGATLECTYSASLPDGATRLNTATATTSGDVDGASGTASVDFTDVPPSSVLHGSVSIDDTFPEGDGGPFSDSTTIAYTRSFTCGEEEGEFQGVDNLVTNTATIVETGQEDDALVTIDCLGELTALKTVSKSTASPGETLDYVVTVLHAGVGPATDDVVDTFDCRFLVDEPSITGGGVLDQNACTITWSGVTMDVGDPPLVFTFSGEISDPLPPGQGVSETCAAQAFTDELINTVRTSRSISTTITCVGVLHPASCSAYALRVELLDTAIIPGTLTSDEIFTASTALGRPGSGRAHGDAQQAGSSVDLPTVTAGGLTFGGELAKGDLTSQCDAATWAGTGEASGQAQTDGLAIDLALTGLPIAAADPVTFTLSSSALLEKGASAGGAGSVGANIYDLDYGGFIGGVPYGGTLFAGAAPPNYVVPLTVPLSTVSAMLTDVTIGYVVLNAQDLTVDANGCAADEGSALVVVLYDLTDTQIAAVPLPPLVTVPPVDHLRITVSHVELSTCPDTGPGGAPEGTPISECNAAGILVDVSTSRLSTTPWGVFSGFSRSDATRHVEAGGARSSARQVDANAALAPPTLPTGMFHADDVVSECDVTRGSNLAEGEASINNLDFSLDVPLAGLNPNPATPAGLQLSMRGQALHTALAVTDGVAAHDQNFVGYVLTVEGTPITIAHNPAPNTPLVNIPGVLEVIANHRAPGAGACAFEDNAIRIRVFDPLAPPGTILIEIKIAHVEARACDL